ncbi:hypothetical protein SISSUDRAFT_1131333 [Sistotremastrum suecicum HHB10207 ss-3]|uniref:Probable RNA polymerase II nuclear localization protein SLC7A6OS n=1 Tax=Sistotremastrum suecicum HHB10207 ss-3 TaxID=1314776 RepID=A0A166AA85_9AGAM|nr:hypothetical protein SISSUDRAFT_1131333 [Sistotremastrum suecicum HHB10207 ss-3]
MYSPPSQPQNARQDSSQFTILRIKRKRNEEPLDALVIEGVRKKKIRGSAGIFQFAETLESDAWEDESTKRAIKDRISTISRSAVSKDVQDSPKSQTPSIAEERTRRYTVVQSTPLPPQPELATKPRSPLKEPPKIWSSRALEKERLAKAANGDFMMYDAVPVADSNAIPLQEDPEMAQFMPLLQEYLSLNEVVPNPDSLNALSTNTQSIPQDRSISSDSEGDYVWDVFFHRPASEAEWNHMMTFGTISGLPPTAEETSDSDGSEIEDEADEDSNDENWYKNDYPEEDTDDSDGSSILPLRRILLIVGALLQTSSILRKTTKITNGDE